VDRVVCGCRLQDPWEAAFSLDSHLDREGKENRSPVSSDNLTSGLKEEGGDQSALVSVNSDYSSARATVRGLESIRPGHRSTPVPEMLGLIQRERSDRPSLMGVAGTNSRFTNLVRREGT
jgi:hypothetical protein